MDSTSFFVYISIFEVNIDGSYKVTTNSIRNLIKEYFKDGKCIRTIGKLVKVSHSTVFAVIKRWKLRDTVENALKLGTPHKLTPRIRSFITHKIKRNPRLSAVKLTTELEKRFAIKENPETVKRAIRSYGYSSRVARRKFFVNEKNKKVTSGFFKIYGRQRYIALGKRHICG
ncbi:hypothetical protein AVEN_230652-1 [Araneus ventricosus]|uniref:Transposase Tc1-like domain-containing protein n=1 Tax=Araneus ventricosus TaxID=182803 RepID=A0A4Y2A2M2_ARAVE|nr:hypothetical protein AVEN_230652-1 [Araneus ventricosus]